MQQSACLLLTILLERFMGLSDCHVARLLTPLLESYLFLPSNLISLRTSYCIPQQLNCWSCLKCTCVVQHSSRSLSSTTCIVWYDMLIRCWSSPGASFTAGGFLDLRSALRVLFPQPRISGMSTRGCATDHTEPFFYAQQRITLL